MTRSTKHVAEILGAELDGMKSEFHDVAWLADPGGLFATFTCGGKLYTVELYETTDEQKEKLGL